SSRRRHTRSKRDCSSDVCSSDLNATVALCHSKTQKLKKITKKADILVVAIGKPKFITKKYVKKHAVVIDVGINKVDGNICGDVEIGRASCRERVKYKEVG